MNNHISVIHDDPAVAGEALLLSLLVVLGANVFDRGSGERVEHAVACAGADHEIVGKRNNIFNIYQDDVFPFFVFKGVYDFTCKF